MAMMECAQCGQPIDSRALRACSGCGAQICSDCDEADGGICPECGESAQGEGADIQK